MQVVYTLHVNDANTIDSTRVPSFESGLRRLMNEFQDLEPKLSSTTERFVMEPGELRKLCTTRRKRTRSTVKKIR